MTTKDFELLWKTIEGKPVNIFYGKQTFKNVKLVKYDKAIRVTYTELKGSLNTSAIKEIHLLEQPPTKEPLKLQPTPTTGFEVNLLDKGYFLIRPKALFCGVWKVAVIVDAVGNEVMASDGEFGHKNLYNWIYDIKQKGLDGVQVPDIIKDATFCIPVYYKIKLGATLFNGKRDNVC